VESLGGVPEGVSGVKWCRIDGVYGKSTREERKHPIFSLTILSGGGVVEGVGEVGFKWSLTIKE